MKKNTYIQPQSEVVNIQFCSIVCASNTGDIGFGGQGNTGGSGSGGAAFAPKKGHPIPY